MTDPRAAASAPIATIDHLVVAATTLADGIDFIASLTGATPQPGGKHATMGTHNALLHLGPRLFLEVIAIDPSAAKPKRPRWFMLDDVAMQSELLESPRLIHWVARATDLHQALHASRVEHGVVHALARGAFRWRITIPDDGTMPARGVLPTLIQWDVPEHPADTLADRHVSLLELAATHPDPAFIRGALAALDLDGHLRVSYDRDTRLAAMLRTPKGVVTLAS